MRTRLALVTTGFLLAASGPLVGVDPAAGALPGPDGRIAYASQKDASFFGIYTSRPDGSDEQVVRLGGYRQPAWSPDGRRLAFTYRIPGELETDVGVMSADGTGEVLLTSTGADRGPTWSPDGARIAFTSERDGHREIWVMDADGSDQFALTSGPDDSEPAWSPDGARIAFTRDGDIWVMGSDGSDPTNLSDDPDSDGGSTWSPDASQIAFTRATGGGDRIVRMSSIDGSGQQQVSGPSDGDLDPTWSPQGDRIAFTCLRDTGGGSTAERCTMSAVDGSGRMTLEENDHAEFDLDWQTSRPRPDGIVRRGSGPQLGDDRYNLTGNGQRARGTVRRGGTVVYFVRAQNDGTDAERLRVMGQRSTARFRVKYRTGGRVVTAAVVNGTHRTPQLAPGAAQTIRVEVTALRATPRGAALTQSVTVRSTRQPSQRDVVQMVTRRA